MGVKRIFNIKNMLNVKHAKVLKQSLGLPPLNAILAKEMGSQLKNMEYPLFKRYVHLVMAQEKLLLDV